MRLRAVERDDLPLAVVYLNDPEVLVWFGPLTPMNMEDEIAWYERMRQDQSVVNFAIELDGRYVGGCGLINIDAQHRRAEIGIFVGDKTIWGKGVGSEAMRLVLGYGFDYLNLHRIYLRAFPENQRAVGIYERLGFRHEGRFRDVEWRHGRWHDLVYMSILEAEWRQQAGAEGRASHE